MLRREVRWKGRAGPRYHNLGPDEGKSTNVPIPTPDA